MTTKHIPDGAPGQDPPAPPQEPAPAAPDTTQPEAAATAPKVVVLGEGQVEINGRRWRSHDALRLGLIPPG